jgi:mono/diheme cytochrome c family protein
MSIFLIKSLLSVLLLLSAFVALFTMFEIYGRTEKKYNVTRLIKVHRANGFFFFILFLILSFLCVRFLLYAQSDLSPRSSLHTVIALALFCLLCFKILVATIYKGFYGKLPAAGLWVALLTFVLIATSGGYYLMAQILARERGPGPTVQKGEIPLRTDPKSIAAGQALFSSLCNGCHHIDRTAWILGPGLKGLLKEPRLPVSGRPATAENIFHQLRKPFKDMPSFKNLSDEEAFTLIAYLNTL